MGLVDMDGKDPVVQAQLNNDATGSPNLPSNIEDSDPRKETVVTSVDDLNNYPIIKDPMFDRAAFDVTTYPNSWRTLQGYTQGHRMSVTYFNAIGQSADVRTHIADYPNERNVANTSYLRINNFEITLRGPLQWIYDKDKGEGNAVGQALAYSCFDPMKGDFFLGAAGDGKLALYRVSTVDPLSWRNQHMTEFGFYFFSYVDAGNLQFLQAATRRTAWFDKRSYLGGTAVLLEEDYYKDLVDLRRFRKILPQYYFRKFFDRGLNSFIRPDGVYDPYVVKYMASACSLRDVMDRPQQLYRDTDMKYDDTIWARLNDDDVTVIDDLNPYFTESFVRGKGNNIMLTPLVNSSVVTSLSQHEFQMNPDVSRGFYVLSDKFYNNDYDHMNELEQLVWMTIKTRVLSNTSNLLANYVRPYMTMDRVRAFYEIPLYLRLIDIAIPSVARRPPSNDMA